MDVQRTAMDMVSVKPTTCWNGSAGATLDGLVKVVTFPWNEIALIDQTMMEVGG